MTISRRLTALIATASACLLLLSGTDQYQMNQVYQAASYGNEATVPSLLALNKVVISFLRIRPRVLSHVVSTDSTSKIAAEKSLSEDFSFLDKALADYGALVSESADRQYLEQETAAYASYRKNVDSVLSASRDFMVEDAMDRLEQGEPAAEQLTNKLLEHMKFKEAQGRQEALSALAARNRATMVAVAVFFGALATLILFSTSIRRSLNIRIAQANLVASRIANGDLKSENLGQVESGDEIGELLRSLETMRTGLTQTIRQVMNNAELVAESAAQLSKSTQEVSDSTEHQTSATTAMASAVEEMTVSIDHIGNNAAEASDRALASGENAADSQTHVNTAADQIAKVAEQIDDTARQTRILADQVDQIGSITAVIRAIAEQTNLLALNAAIEAARAGDQGRGFAVVADEVRKLAERTTTSVKEIGTVVQDIQDGAAKTFDSIQTTREVVREVVGVAGIACNSMMEIREASNTVCQSIEGISMALREQKSTSTELARNVESIAQMSEQNASAADSVASTADRLLNLSSALKSSVSVFHL